jgi:uncharacterized protein
MGPWARPADQHATRELLAGLGFAHEARYVAAPEADGRTVRRFPARSDPRTWPDAHAETVDALNDGVDVLYQATLFDGHVYGRPDFLVRVDVPDRDPASGDAWRCEVVDTKLARHAGRDALLQTLVYAELLQQATGWPAEPSIPPRVGPQHRRNVPVRGRPRLPAPLAAHGGGGCRHMPPPVGSGADGGL